MHTCISAYMHYNYLPPGLAHALSCLMAWCKLTNNKERFCDASKEIMCLYSGQGKDSNRLQRN